MAGVPNYLTIFLASNYDVGAGSSITISGLRHSLTKNTSDLSIWSSVWSDDVFGSSGIWDQGRGLLVVTLSQMMLSQRAYLVMFKLYNPLSAQTSPSVSIQAELVGSMGVPIGAMQRVSFAKSEQSLYGIPFGADALTVVNQHISAFANVGPSAQAQLQITSSRTGLQQASGAARLQATGCEATHWVSDTHAACRASAGNLRSQKVIVTVGENAVPASVSNAVSFDIPLVTSLAASNRDASFQSAIVLSGIGLGRIDISFQARAGGTASESTAWISTSSALCLLADVSRAQGSLKALVTAGNQVGCTRTDAWSTDVSTLSHAQRQNHNLATLIVTVLTWHIRMEHTSHTRSMLTGCQATAWTSSSSLQCQTPRAGFRMTNSLTLTAGARASATISELWSVDSIILLKPGRSILGHSFSLPPWNASKAVSYANQNTSNTTFQSSSNATSRLDCTTAPCRNNTTNIFAYVDTSAPFRIAPTPAAQQSVPNSNSSLGNRSAHAALPTHFSIYVLGDYFDVAMCSARARVGNSACEASLWASDSAMRCFKAWTKMSSRSACLTLAQTTGTITHAFSMEIKSLLALGTRHNTSSNVMFTGQSNQTTRQAFSIGMPSVVTHLPTHTASCRASFSSAQATVWLSSTSLSINFRSRAAQSSRGVVVTLGAKATSLCEVLTFDAAVATLPVGNQGETSSLGPMVAISGTGFGGKLLLTRRHSLEQIKQWS